MFFFLNNSKVFQNLKWFIRLKILARLAFYKKSNHSKKKYSVKPISGVPSKTAP